MSVIQISAASHTSFTIIYDVILLKVFMMSFYLSWLKKEDIEASQAQVYPCKDSSSISIEENLNFRDQL